jgi:hypothetical protein
LFILDRTPYFHKRNNHLIGLYTKSNCFFENFLHSRNKTELPYIILAYTLLFSSTTLFIPFINHRTRTDRKSYNNIESGSTRAGLPHLHLLSRPALSNTKLRPFKFNKTDDLLSVRKYNPANTLLTVH